MIDHVSIQCFDLAASSRFFDSVLTALGYSRVVDLGTTIGYGASPRPQFWIGTLEVGEGFRESHLAFKAPDRSSVVAFHQAAVALGSEVLHEPGLRAEYGPNYFATFLRDPDGNNVEAVCHRVE